MSQMLCTPCTWEQSAAQIVTPTTSALSTINAIQSCVAASSSWTVASTGTISTGAKFLEIKPSNTSSVYAGYRLVFFEKVVSATNKSAAASMSGTITWNSTSAIYYHFCPDGGSGTFTPANCEGANNSYIYVGSSTSYKYNAGGGIYNDVWGAITLPATAVWTYLCEGAFWLVNRSAATSHTLVGVGALMAGATAYTNPGGAAWMQPMSYFRSGITNTTFAPSNMFATNTPLGLWSPGYTVNSSALTTLSTPAAATYGGVFLPIFPQNGRVLRGIYNTNNYKTRTTLQDNGSTVGYVWFPDDAQLGPTLTTLAFMHT
jgi:hypothetical protein